MSLHNRQVTLSSLPEMDPNTLGVPEIDGDIPGVNDVMRCQFEVPGGSLEYAIWRYDTPLWVLRSNSSVEDAGDILGTGSPGPTFWVQILSAVAPGSTYVNLIWYTDPPGAVMLSRIELRTADPPTPAVGEIWLRTDL